jgi:HSP20 family protein
VPGIPEDKISVEFEDGSLTVSGERERMQEVSEDRLDRIERRFGSFTRTIGLPQGVGEDAVEADYRDGVLEVRVRKPEQPKPRRIQVGAGEKATIEGKSK